MIRVEKRRTTAAALSHAAVPLDRPKISRLIVIPAKTDAFVTSIRMMDAGQRFTGGRRICAPVKSVSAAGRTAMKAEEREVVVTRSGQQIAATAGLRHGRNIRRQAV